jgi:hypothetical protein
MLSWNSRQVGALSIDRSVARISSTSSGSARLTTMRIIAGSNRGRPSMISKKLGTEL